MTCTQVLRHPETQTALSATGLPPALTLPPFFALRPSPLQLTLRHRRFYLRVTIG